MKVNCIATDTLALAVTPIGDRLYKVAENFGVSIFTISGGKDATMKGGI